MTLTWYCNSCNIFCYLQVGSVLSASNALYVRGSISGGGLIVGQSTVPAETVNIAGYVLGMQTISFTAQNVIFQESSVVSADGSSMIDGKGVGYTDGFVSGGASHGGSGGASIRGIVGLPYGSYLFPSLLGSRGGPSPQDATSMKLNYKYSCYFII